MKRKESKVYLKRQNQQKGYNREIKDGEKEKTKRTRE